MPLCEGLLYILICLFQKVITQHLECINYFSEMKIRWMSAELSFARNPEGHKYNQRAGAPLLWGQAEELVLVQSGEENALRRSHCEEVLYSEGREALAQLPREAVDAPSLKAFKARLDGPWAAWAGGWQPCPWQRIETIRALRSLPTQTML